jgi:hypothetical protein
MSRPATTQGFFRRYRRGELVPDPAPRWYRALLLILAVVSAEISRALGLTVFEMAVFMAAFIASGQLAALRWLTRGEGGRHTTSR